MGIAIFRLVLTIGVLCSAAARAQDEGAATAAHLRAQRLLYSGQTERVIEAWETALRGRPDSSEMLSALGATLHFMGRSAAAVPHLNRASALAPDDWTLGLFLGTVLHAAGKAPEARTQLQRVVELASNRGTVQIAREKLDGTYYRHAAQAAARAGVSERPTASKWSIQLIHVPWAMGNTSKSNELHDDGSTVSILVMVVAASRGLPPQAPSRKPTLITGGDYIDLHYLLPIRIISYARGRYLVAVGSPEGARDASADAARHTVLQLLEFGLDHVRAIKTDPGADKTLALKLRSVQQTRSGDRAGAMTSLREALEIAPDDPHARGHLAALLAAEGDRAAALSELSFVLSVWPDHPGTNFLSGALERNSGRLQEAQARLKVAIALRPTMWEAYYNLAQVYLDSGQRAAAIEALEQAGETAPYVRQIQNQLSELRGK